MKDLDNVEQVYNNPIVNITEGVKLLRQNQDLSLQLRRSVALLDAALLQFKSTPSSSHTPSHRSHTRESNPVRRGATPSRDLRHRLHNVDAHTIINEQHRQREENEKKRREEYERQWGPLGGNKGGNLPPQF